MVARIGRDRFRLPAAVEARSFQGSASGKELRKQLLNPLRLAEERVCFLDAYPYYLASASARGERSMWPAMTFIRECAVPEAQRLLYGLAERRAVFGLDLEIVHVAHPGFS